MLAYHARIEALGFSELEDGMNFLFQNAPRIIGFIDELGNKFCLSNARMSQFAVVLPCLVIL